MPPRHLLLALLLGCVPLAGCTGDSVGTKGDRGVETPNTNLLRKELRARALETIDSGILYKPASDAEGLVAYDLAPLIIQDLAGDGAGAGPVDEVRWWQDDVEIGGRTHERWTFFWQTGRGETRSVRMTFDSAGFPAIWEVLGAIEPRRGVYVSTDLEAAAVAVHGQPANGDFATERPEDDGVVVVRAIEAGPMAMGPFVTVAGDRGWVSSLICRCMPTQVLDIPATATYALVESDPEDPLFPEWDDTTPGDWLRLDGIDF